MSSLLALLLVAGLAPAPRPIPETSRQLVVVTTPDWTHTTGQMVRYARASPRAAWRQVGPAVPVVVGRSGLGWGRGLHGAGAPDERSGPGKAEGDGRSPAGVFTLTDAFGYAEAVATGLPYLQATPELECVDDAASSRYNEVIQRPAAPDYASHEEMRRTDDLYRAGVVVAHNVPAVPRGGSCIFLHQWSGPRSTTSGCTALAAAPLDALVAWLQPGAVLVQLPQAEYRRLRRAWRLP